jgi:hypothetical protein
MRLVGICCSRDAQGRPNGWYLQVRRYPRNLRQWFSNGGNGGNGMGLAALPAEEGLSQAKAVMKGVIKGLNFLHQMGIIHRDLKPENIMLTDDQPPFPVLIDFETAKVNKPSLVTTTCTRVVGTGKYVAPEVLQQGYSPASDMYAVGIILGELLAGQVLNADDQRVVRQLQHRDPAQRPSAVALLQSPFFQPPRGDCCICGESFPLREGSECRADARHFLCSDCFSGHVLHQAGQDLRLLRQRDARLMCALWAPKEPRPPTHCAAPPFLDDEVARCANAEAFKVYVDSRTKLAEERLAKDMQADHDQRLKAELRRLQQMDERSRKVEAAAHQLRDVLCDHCPRCKQVFVDFTGCFALTCGNCGCGFCAWCLADCGNDAHAHVAHCAHNLAPGKGVFSTEALFKEGRRLRQTRAAEQLLQRLQPGLAGEVTAKCRKDLQDVGLGRLVNRFGQGRAGGSAGDDFEYALALQLGDE